MKTADAFVALAGAAGTAVAAPAEGTGLMFSVPVENIPTQPNILADAHNVLRKYATPETMEKFEADILAHPEAASLIQRGENTTIGAFPYGPEGVDRSYLCEVNIGTPPQTLKLNFDTGSSDLWVFSTDTNTSELNGQALYKPAQSTTSKLLKCLKWLIGYADGSGSQGIVYQDVVKIGTASVTNQAVESAQQVSAQFANDTNTSGLLGLAYDKGNTVSPKKQMTWFSNIKSRLAQPLFTVRLKHQEVGSYNFGYIDKSQYTGEISYTPASTDDLGHRLFQTSGYAIADAELNNRVITGTADTGSSIVLLPNDIASEYWSNVAGALGLTLGIQTSWFFNCNASLPTFSFGVGTGRITIHSDNINYSPLQGSDLCLGGIGGLQGVPGIDAIFGDVALKSGFVVFDDGNNRLGWAEGA